MKTEGSDLLLRNGKIRVSHAGDVVAGALLVRDGLVAAVGDESEVRASAGAAPEIDLQGATALPGLIDAHCHLLWYGEMLSRWVDLRGASSMAEIQSRLRARLAERPPAPGEWLLGRSFEQDRLEGARMPTDADLDAVSAEIPIVIRRVCGHALVANTPAQEVAGVHPPEGLLTEGDMAPVSESISPMSPAERLDAALAACREAASAGFTGAHCIVHGREEVEAFRELARRGDLPIHLRLMANEMDALDAPGSDEIIPCRTLKLFVDGSLGAHTAALSAPYSDMPETSGRIVIGEDDLCERVAAAHRAGYQVAVHAIGDAAVAMAIRAIATVMAADPGSDPRHRIEHASVTPPHLVDRMAAFGIAAVVQPQFTVSDFWTLARLGPERIDWAYPFRSMLDRGVFVAAGTDCPVELLEPFQVIARAVSRSAAEQSLSVSEAVGLLTAGAAYAGFSERERGALRPGFRADLVVVPEDPWLLSPPEIEALCPELTVVDGRVAHASGRFASLSICRGTSVPREYA